MEPGGEQGSGPWRHGFSSGVVLKRPTAPSGPAVCTASCIYTGNNGCSVLPGLTAGCGVVFRLGVTFPSLPVAWSMVCNKTTPASTFCMAVIPLRATQPQPQHGPILCQRDEGVL